MKTMVMINMPNLRGHEGLLRVDVHLTIDDVLLYE